MLAYSKLLSRSRLTIFGDVGLDLLKNSANLG
jgi:hypothetical protein